MLNIGGYRPIASEKGHARIIWDCAWSKVGGLFATAGRDKLVRPRSIHRDVPYRYEPYLGKSLAAN